MKLIRYDIDNPGILPNGFVPNHISGSWAYAKIDERIPAFNNLNYITVDDYEYASEPQRIFHEAIEAGYVTDYGYTLAISDPDRNQWVQLLVMFREGNASDDTTVSFADINGQLHQLPLNQFREMILKLGSYYQEIWTAYRSSAV